MKEQAVGTLKKLVEISSPFVVKVVEYFVEEGQLIVVQEYC